MNRFVEELSSVQKSLDVFGVTIVAACFPCQPQFEYVDVTATLNRFVACVQGHFVVFVLLK